MGLCGVEEERGERTKGIQGRWKGVMGWCVRREEHSFTGRRSLPFLMR